MGCLVSQWNINVTPAGLAAGSEAPCFSKRRDVSRDRLRKLRFIRFMRAFDLIIWLKGALSELHLRAKDTSLAEMLKITI
jgi:hypothetical protein